MRPYISSISWQHCVTNSPYVCTWYTLIYSDSRKRQCVDLRWIWYLLPSIFISSRFPLLLQYEVYIYWVAAILTWFTLTWLQLPTFSRFLVSNLYSVKERNLDFFPIKVKFIFVTLHWKKRAKKLPLCLLLSITPMPILPSCS